MLQVGSDWRVMGESRLIVEELLAMCLQRITMEDDAVNTEQGEADSLRPSVTTLMTSDLLKERVDPLSSRGHMVQVALIVPNKRLLSTVWFSADRNVNMNA